MFSLLAGYKVFKFGTICNFNHREFLVSLSVSTLLVAFVFLSSVSTPYRQDGSLFRSNSPLWGASRILEPSVSPETSKTINTLRSIADRVSPEIIKPFSILDLTGQSPGLIFAVGAKTVGQPWLAGGYPGSESAMRWVLDSLDTCKRLNSLVLVEERGTRSLPMELLSQDGWNFVKDYQSLGSFEVIAGTGFLGKSRKIELFQPNDSVFLKFSECF